MKPETPGEDAGTEMTGGEAWELEEGSPGQDPGPEREAEEEGTRTGGGGETSLLHTNTCSDSQCQKEISEEFSHVESGIM